MLAAVLGFLWKGLHEPVAALIRIIKTLRRDSDELRRAALRKQLAEYFERSLMELAGQDGWDSSRFTELEADYYPGLAPAPGLGRRLLHRDVQVQKALSRSLASPLDPLTILEGDPGSGKSVLLRQAALSVVTHAKRAHMAPLAMYVNLKTLE